MSNKSSYKTSNSNKIQLVNPEKSEDLISTLPKENGWFSNNNNPLYCYQGSWYDESILRGLIDVQDEVNSGNKFSSFDIIIASNPKSGTTWLKGLYFSISTRTRFPVSHFDCYPLISSNPHRLILVIETFGASNKIYLDLPLLATHLPYTALPSSILDGTHKILYIWRDPKDALSLWQFIVKLTNKNVNEPIQMEEAFDLFFLGIPSYGSYWDHVLGYWKAFLDHPVKILFLKYEDMIKDVQLHVKKLAKFTGYPFLTKEKEDVVLRIIELCTFESMRNFAEKKWEHCIKLDEVVFNNEAFFRKGKIGDSKNYLTKEMANKIDQITFDKLEAYGLTISSS